MGRNYRAIYFGTLPSGRAVREGEIIREEELEGRKPGLWMEEIKDAESAPPPSAPAPNNEVAIALDEAPLAEEVSESAPAESKRQLRNRKR